MDPVPGGLNVGAFDLPLLAQVSWAEGLPSLIVTLVVVLVLSFLAAMVEAAFLCFATTKAKAWEHSENPLEAMAAKLRLDFAKPLATMVIFNNATNIAGAAVTTFYAENYFEQLFADQGPRSNVGLAMGIYTGVLTLIIILAGEIVPKTIGENHSASIVKYSAYPIRWLQVAFAPIVWLCGIVQKPFQRIGPHETTEEEIAHLSTIAQEQGAIEEREEDMIHRVLKLDDITVEQIMTPRVEMVSLQADQTLAQAAEELSRINRSLIPLWRKNRDDVVAILARMDALLALAKDKGDLLLTDESLSSRPFYVPRSMTADKLLVKLQRRTDHLAVVVGEYGETVGIVTLEDVIEELIGEIYDEEDIGSGSGIQKITTDEVVCLGAVEVKDLNNALGTEIPNHRSVAGLLLDAMERIPQKGEVLEVNGVRFAIEEADDRAILKVRVTKIPTEPPPSPDESQVVASE